MNRRHAHGRPTPSLTPDRDEAKPACANDLGRLLLDHLRETELPDPEMAEALNHMCAGCPLRLECHAEHKGQRWLRNLGKRPVGKRNRASCGTMSGARKHRRTGEPMCAGCREAENAAARERTRRKRAAAKEAAA